VANNRLELVGLEELRAALRALPAELAAEAGGIVDHAGELAKAEIIQRYPRRTGNLRDHVTIRTVNAGQFGAAVQVRSSAKHAHIYEIGTQARHNKLGANRGSMPPGNVFVPVVVRQRRQMMEQLKALLVRNGLVVTGDAG
jgi:hypothetical protein